MKKIIKYFQKKVVGSILKIMKLRSLVKMGKNCISQDINKEYFLKRQDSFRKMNVFFVWYGLPSANWLANRGIDVLNKNIFIVR